MRSEESVPRDRPGSAAGAVGIAGAAMFVSVLISMALDAWLVLPVVLLFTLMVSLLFGMPVFLFLREKRRANWLTVSIGGFLTGAIVPALMALGRRPDQASVGGVSTVIDGRYTAAGWGEALLMIGAFGAVGIVGAWLAWCAIGWTSGTARRRRSLALAGLVVAAVAGASALPWAMRDRSCHNALRDGRVSIGSTAEFELHLPMAEWNTLREELEQFAGERRWSFRADVRPDPGFPWFQASLCTEPGTVIFAEQVPLDGGYIAIGALQPQGGDSWQAPLRALQDRIEKRWPGRIGYPAGESAAPAPPWAPPVRSASPAPSSAVR